MNFFVDHMEALILIITNLIVVIASYFRLRNKVDNTDKDIQQLSEKITDEINDIEKTRLRNVEALREIYDSKIMDSKNHAKSLFEVREMELRDLGKRMGILETKFDKQTELINEKFNQLIKTNAFIEAHIKTCPYFGTNKT